MSLKSRRSILRICLKLMRTNYLGKKICAKISAIGGNYIGHAKAREMRKYIYHMYDFHKLLIKLFNHVLDFFLFSFIWFWIHNINKGYS